MGRRQGMRSVAFRRRRAMGIVNERLALLRQLCVSRLMRNRESGDVCANKLNEKTSEMNHTAVRISYGSRAQPMDQAGFPNRNTPPRVGGPTLEL